MFEELSREIQKLDARIERFIEKEAEFVKQIRNCLSTFQALNHKFRPKNTQSNVNTIKEILNVKSEAIESFSDAMAMASDAEHERSHLLESYGALLLATENAFMTFVSEQSNIAFT
jgi:hypothetical protein